jgi:hypothetical protein
VEGQHYDPLFPQAHGALTGAMSLSKPMEATISLDAMRKHIIKRNMQRAVDLSAAAFFLDSDSDEPERPSKARRVFKRSDYSNCTWMRDYLNHPDLINFQPGSRTARDFRRGFRIPYQLFLELVQLVRLKEWFPAAERDCAGRDCIPLELKVCPHSSSLPDCPCRCSVFCGSWAVLPRFSRSRN